MGAPLVHPLLHDHYGHSDGEVNLSGIVIQAAKVDVIDNDCLICHFFGTSHVIAPNPPPTVAMDVPSASRLGGYLASYGKSSLIPIIPRAPPLGLLFPTA